MYPEIIKNLIRIFADLPGVGERAATRYVFYFLKKPKKDIDEFIENLDRLKKEIALCSKCYNIAQISSKNSSNLCVICQDKERRKEQICLVEKISDIDRIESMHFYNGVYHVLTGLINPVKGITPQKLTFNRLVSRLKEFKRQEKTPELIMALNPTREGDLTVNYTKEILAPLKIKITRLARGIPTGGELQYADEDTLKESFTQRKEL
ncbi:MAG: recombination mediator RecR [Candidatus Paceibacterota bacterium]